MKDNKQFEQFTDFMQTMMPKISTSKNGYEIRTKVLEFAQNQAWQDYHAKWAGYETSIIKDKTTGEIVTSVEMPEIPGADKVLETAQQFYDFVNGSHNKTK